MKNILIQGPSGQLEVEYQLGEWTKPWVVIAHPHSLHGGSMQNKVVTTLARAAHKLGMTPVRFNFRGVGKSQGVFDDGCGEQADLVQVVQWVRQEQQFLAMENDEKDPRNHQAWCSSGVFLAGFSFGAYVTYAAASHIKPQHLLSVAPATNIWTFAALDLPAPWALIQGGQDEVVNAPDNLHWAINHPQRPDIHWRAQASHYFHGQLPWLGQCASHIWHDALNSKRS